MITTITEEALAVPAEAFNADGIAAILAAGSRYGGRWRINIVHGEEAIGCVWTDVTDDPDDVAAAAVEWLRDECARLGLKIVQVESFNNQYGPNERPYFTTSRVLIVDKDWV